LGKHSYIRRGLVVVEVVPDLVLDYGHRLGAEVQLDEVVMLDAVHLHNSEGIWFQRHGFHLPLECSPGVGFRREVDEIQFTVAALLDQVDVRVDRESKSSRCWD